MVQKILSHSRPDICHFFSINVLLGSIFLHMKARKLARFSTSYTCHMWRISNFSTYVTWRHLKFLHMRRNAQFFYNCHSWKAEISPHDNFFSTYYISDKYHINRPPLVQKTSRQRHGSQPTFFDPKNVMLQKWGFNRPFRCF